MRDLPKLIWLNGKTHPQGNGGRKNRSGYAEEHRDALIENASRKFANEVQKAFSTDNPENKGDAF